MCYNFLVVSCNLDLAADNRELILEILVLKVFQNFLNHLFFIRVRSSVLDLKVFTNRFSNPAQLTDFFGSVRKCNLFLSNLISFYGLRSVNSQVLRELVFIFHV